MADEGLSGESGGAAAHVATPSAATSAVLAGLAVLATACGSATPSAETARIARTHEAPALPYAEAPDQWGVYHSLRFRMSLPLPNGRAWKIDDHSRGELLATEAGTHSTITVLGEHEPTLVNHQLCEARARTLGLVPERMERSLQSIEDSVIVGPEAYDTRVRVAIERDSGPERRLVGHVFAFGAYVDKCFVFHLATDVRSEEEEQTLSQRLALGRFRILAGIKVDELGSVPRGKNPP